MGLQPESYKQARQTTLRGWGASRARRTHTLYVLVHSRPIKAKTEAVQGVVRVQVTANGVCVECDELNIAYLTWDQLKARIGGTAAYWFLKYEHAILIEI